jgi:hypothetical protein
MLSHKWEGLENKWAVKCNNIKITARDRISISSIKEVKGSSQVCISSVLHTSRLYLLKDTLAPNAT